MSINTLINNVEIMQELKETLPAGFKLFVESSLALNGTNTSNTATNNYRFYIAKQLCNALFSQSNTTTTTANPATLTCQLPLTTYYDMHGLCPIYINRTGQNHYVQYHLSGSGQLDINFDLPNSITIPGDIIFIQGWGFIYPHV